MIYLLVAFFSSLILILLLIRYKHVHEHLSGDYGLSSPQKFHEGCIPRIGGVGIYIAVWITNLVIYLKDPTLGAFISLILIAALPVSIAGFAEDLTKRISVKTRLIAGLISGAILLNLFEITSIRIDISGLDDILLNVWFAGIFLCIACSGLANAYNIIDGFNGLASMVGIISSAAIAFVAFKVGDPLLTYSALTLICAVFGFFIWNYPRGLIFLGDGGAYFIGFMIASLSILLVYRQPEVSPWFALLVNAYPVVETIFTIWRRLAYQGKNPGIADKAHFHSLIYRRALRLNLKKGRQKKSLDAKNSDYQVITNAKTSPFLWLLTCIGAIPATLLWQSTHLLILCFILFIGTYLYGYRTITQRRAPWWLGTSPTD